MSADAYRLRLARLAIDDAATPTMAPKTVNSVTFPPPEAPSAIELRAKRLCRAGCPPPLPSDR